MSFLSLLFALLSLFGLSKAGFNPQSRTNLAVYWDQNSADSHTAVIAQSRLIDYCQDPMSTSSSLPS